MSNKKKILISILSLALCVLVTFAWINELQNPEGRVMALRLTNASIANNDLEIKLFVNTAHSRARLFTTELNKHLVALNI